MHTELPFLCRISLARYYPPFGLALVCFCSFRSMLYSPLSALLHHENHTLDGWGMGRFGYDGGLKLRLSRRDAVLGTSEGGSGEMRDARCISGWRVVRYSMNERQSRL